MLSVIDFIKMYFYYTDDFDVNINFKLIACINIELHISLARVTLLSVFGFMYVYFFIILAIMMSVLILKYLSVLITSSFHRILHM